MTDAAAANAAAATSTSTSAAGYDLRRPSDAEMTKLTASLDREEARVLLHHGTERPFCGTLLDNKKTGTYVCRVCGLPLFSSHHKFDSGTGWPSFFAPFDEAHVANLRDSSHGMARVENRCARCDSHLGHVFPDGPPPTRSRFCMNSISLEFVEAGTPLPDLLNRGDPTDH